MKKLGFGLMRLPQSDPDDWSKVDREAAQAMIDRYLAAGFTYFDTAYVYHGDSSERLFGELVAKRYDRDAYVLTTKMPVFNSDYVKSPQDYERIFAEQLARCQVDYFDYYLLHGIGKNRYADIQRMDGFAFLQRKKAEGKIRHIGFSYHDDAETLAEILDDHPETEMVQLQLNYIDWDDESVQARKCYEICAERGISVVVMEPLKGGSLANLPPEAAALLKKANPEASLASWGIRFAASPEQVMVVLSGMSDMAQLEDNISYMSDFTPLSEAEHKLLEQCVGIIHDSIAIPCTACRYCIAGCPKQIAIPAYFALYNNQKQFGLLPGLASNYLNLTVKFGKPDDCIGCGHCEGHCPQHLPISRLLEQVSKAFA